MSLPLSWTISELQIFLTGDLEFLGDSVLEPPAALAPFESAGSHNLAVLPKRASPLQIRACQAGMVVGSPGQVEDWRVGRIATGQSGVFLRVQDSGWALWKLLDGPCRSQESPEDWLSVEELVDRFGVQARTAMVHGSAVIGTGTWLGSGTVVQARVRVGEGCRIGEGTVLGAPGFGMVEWEGRSWPLPHGAGVEIESDVWLGPQCQVSAGLLEPTFLGNGCRLDAQIQVGHNARIGPGCVLAGQTGLAGSVVLGAGCLVGGQVGIAEHVVLGEDCQVAARSGVTRSWPTGTLLGGFPAIPIREWRRGMGEEARIRSRRSV